MGISAPWSWEEGEVAWQPRGTSVSSNPAKGSSQLGTAPDLPLRPLLWDAPQKQPTHSVFQADTQSQTQIPNGI